MDLRSTPEEDAFRASVRATVADAMRTLDRSDPATAPVDAPPHLWQEAVRAGWLEMAELEEPGEAYPYSAVLMQELGRSGLATPVAEAVATGALVAFAGVELRDASAAEPPPTSAGYGALEGLRVTLRPDAREEGDLSTVAVGAKRIDGGSVTAAWVGAASELLVPVRVDGGVGLAVLAGPAGGEQVPATQVLDHDSIATVAVQGRAPRAVAASKTSPDGRPALWEGLAAARLLRSWEMLGAAGRALELTASHVETREQFGQTLASMQAVQLRLADMWTELEAAELLAAEATDMVARGEPFRPVTECATFAAGRAAEDVTKQAIYLHGGVGYVWEYELHWHYRRVKALRLRQGTLSRQLQGVVAEKLKEVAVDRYPAWPRG